MADDDKPAGTAAPVEPHDTDAPKGARQDGPGAAPPRADRTDATPAGATADARTGPRQGTGSDDPFAAHRGVPARPITGAATGSGAGTGGGGAGEQEQPDTDTAGGGGRDGGA